MIVSKFPRFDHVLRALAIPLSLLFVWDVAVTAFYLKTPYNMRSLELPLSLFGTAIALFIGFMVNAAYARWWEARGLWGAMVNASRSLAREALTFCDRGEDDVARQIAHDMVRSQIGYIGLLRTTLRGEAISTDIEEYLSHARTRAPGGVSLTAMRILLHIGRLANEALKAGIIDPIARSRIETTLVDITNAQGGVERIKNTPLPSQYRFFPYLFARMFCLLLPFAVVDDLGILTPIGSTLVGLMFLMAVQIGSDLMDPFANTIHDVPMTAICRNIEIDLLQMIGDAAPEKITPKDGVLW